MNKQKEITLVEYVQELMDEEYFGQEDFSTESLVERINSMCNQQFIPSACSTFCDRENGYSLWILG